MNFKLTVILVIFLYIIYYLKDYLENPAYNTDISKIECDPLSLKYIKNGKVDKSSLFTKKTMDHDIQKENLLLLKEFLYSKNIRYYIDCGTMLGAVRDKDLIKGDTDADIMISKPSVKDIRKNRHLLEKMGFISFRNSDSWMSMSLLRKGEYIDLYSFWWHIPFELIEYPFLGTYFPVPKFYEEYLTEVYNNWETPSNSKGGFIIFLRNWEWGMKKYVKNHTVPILTDNIVNFRYKPLKYKMENILHKINGYTIDESINLNKLPPIFQIFDYKIHGFNSFLINDRLKGNAKSAKLVYCFPKRALTNSFEEFSDLQNDDKRILVVMGEDTHSSKLSSDQKNKILNKFSTVFWEANKDPDFLTLPMGLISCYISLNGLEKAEDAIKRAVGKEKTKLMVIPEWNLLSTSLKNPKNAVSSRTRLGEFVDETKEHGFYDFINIEPRDYYETISNYKFMVCPTGNGIQAPKIFEAILVRTIPIVENELCFRQLKELGVPLLIVEKWYDLTEEFLSNVKIDVDWEEAINLCSMKGVTEIIQSKL